MAATAITGTMIERREQATRSPGAEKRLGISAHGESRPVQQRPVHSETHPLLGAFPLTVMALATFMLLFVLIMARLKVGADPVFRSSRSAPVSFVGSNGAAVVTRSSRTGASGATTTAAGQESGTRNAVILTSASATPPARFSGDD